jgi:hypothetical protein
MAGKGARRQSCLALRSRFACAAYALQGETERAGAALAEARRLSERPRDPWACTRACGGPSGARISRPASARWRFRPVMAGTIFAVQALENRSKPHVLTANLDRDPQYQTQLGRQIVAVIEALRRRPAADARDVLVELRCSTVGSNARLPQRGCFSVSVITISPRVAEFQSDLIDGLACPER